MKEALRRSTYCVSPFVELVLEETKIICLKKKKIRPVIASWGLAFTEQSMRELSGVLERGLGCTNA